MQNETRELFEQYTQRQAAINGVSRSAVGKSFTVKPAIQQKLEKAAQESSDFLKKINVMPVKEQEGQKLRLGSKGPGASTNNTSDGSKRRNPSPNHQVEGQGYRCRKVNHDTALSYEEMDAWAMFPNFQQLIAQSQAEQIALDRITIGFNGTHYSDVSDSTAYPLLQDCGAGWIQKIRDEAPHRIISDVTITARDEDNQIVARGTYGNLDAAVFDAKNSLLASWHKKAPDLVVILSPDLLTSVNFPRLNALSQTNPNSELLAAQLILSTERVGGLPAFTSPMIPDGVVLITSFKNLSVYYQLGSARRSVVEEAHYNRVATYQSSNDDYVVEDLGKAALIDGIKFAAPGAAAPASYGVVLNAATGGEGANEQTASEQAGAE